MASGPITLQQIDGKKMETVADFIFLASKSLQMVSEDMKLKKSYNKPRQHIKKQRHHFANKGSYCQSYGFSSSHVWMWDLGDKSECWRIDALELWCWRRLLRVPWTAGRSNQSILKEINPEYSLEFWSSNTLGTWCQEPTHWKWPWCWERLRAGGEEGDREWDGLMATPTQWTWVWANSRR